MLFLLKNNKCVAQFFKVVEQKFVVKFLQKAKCYQKVVSRCKFNNIHLLAPCQAIFTIKRLEKLVKFSEDSQAVPHYKSTHVQCVVG